MHLLTGVVLKGNNISISWHDPYWSRCRPACPGREGFKATLLLIHFNHAACGILAMSEEVYHGASPRGAPLKQPVSCGDLVQIDMEDGGVSILIWPWDI